MDLIKREQKLAVDVPAEFADLFNIAGNMEGVVPRLPQIKIIHQGQLFEFSDGSKDGEFEGVILDQHPANAWWEQSATESGGSSVPDCFSMNGVTPYPQCEEGETNNKCCINRQSDKCEDCPQNQYGSDTKTGKGKACKNMKRVMVLMEGSTLPRRLTVTPTSLKSFDNYMTQLVDRGLPYPAVVTSFFLEKKIAGTNTYSEIKFVFKRILSKEELVIIGKLIRSNKDIARGQEIVAEEYGSSNETKDTPESDIPF